MCWCKTACFWNPGGDHSASSHWPLGKHASLRSLMLRVMVPESPAETRGNLLRSVRGERHRQHVLEMAGRAAWFLSQQCWATTAYCPEDSSHKVFRWEHTGTPSHHQHPFGLASWKLERPGHTSTHQVMGWKCYHDGPSALESAQQWW